MPRKARVKDHEILELFDREDTPICTVPEMAEELPIGDDGLRRRLKELEKKGEVTSRQVGARSVVWWKEA